METKRWMLACAAVLALLAGCKTVVVQSEPSGGKVKVSGEAAVSPAPAEVSANIFGATHVTVSRDGYAPRTVPIGFSSPTPYTVKLDRLFNIRANQDGAKVYVDGIEKGVTPAAKVAINDSAESVVRVSKKGWLDATCKVTPSTPSDIELVMDQDGPGRYLYDLVIEGGNIKFKKTPIHATVTVAEPSRSAPPVHKLTSQGNIMNSPNGEEYILSFRLLPNGKNLITSILKRVEPKPGVVQMSANLWNLDASLEGAPRENLTSGESFNVTPNPSIDGKTLFYASTQGNGRLGLWSMDLENVLNGSENLLSADPGMADFFPAINPTGDVLAYSELSAVGTTSIWTKELEGRQRRIQLPGEGYDGVWSPDGNYLLFVRGDKAKDGARLWLRETKTGKIKKLNTRNEEYNDLDPQWSPDGKKIVFSSRRGVQDGVHNYDIWIMDVEGGNPVQLTTNSSCDDKPVFSPDGRQIYFRSNRGLAWDIWVMDLKD